ncbi:MAG: hypothetical protein O7G88_23490 [bacterium]|nr:hypothetical protein [bacterium]
MTAFQTRHDLGVYNEAGAISVTSQSALERIIQSAHDMKGLFRQHLVIAQELVQDDEFIARVVVNDALMADEENWLGRVTGILHIPCGRLLLCAGFDLDDLADFSKMGQNEFIYPIEVPAGDYQVDIYTYVNSINGGFCLPDTVKLGAWFRSSYPATPFPLWLAAICEQEPEQDPGYEDLWAEMEEATEDGRLSFEMDPTALIDFVIQLRPLGKDILLSAIAETEDGFFAPDVGARLPTQFPLGVRSFTLTPNDYGMGILLADINQSSAVPRSNDLIFAGKRSNFFRADISNVPQNELKQALSALFQGRYPRHDVPEYLMSVAPSIESIDVVMHAMGFDLLGDMLCERSSDIVMRGYACVDSQTFAVLMVGTSGQHGLDFYTRFDDDSSQTTSSLPGLDDIAEVGIFRTSYPHTDYQTLYTMHLQLIEQRTTQGAQVQAITPTLGGLATDIDEFLQRQGV